MGWLCHGSQLKFSEIASFAGRKAEKKRLDMVFI